MIEIDVRGETVALHTGGAPLDPHRAAILMHGAGMDHTAWRYQTRRLASLGIAPVAPDLPGHGRSTGSPLASIEALGDWVGALIDALDVDEVDLVGHSMGSFVALEAARLRSSAVRRIVLVSTSDRMAVHPELVEAAAAGDDHALDLMIGWMHTGSHRFGGHKTAGSWKAGAVRSTLERHLGDVLATDLRACDEYDPIAVAPAVTSPVSIIQGDVDRMTPLSGARRLADALPDARLEVMPAAGHMVVFETSTRAQDLLVELLTADPVAGEQP